MNSIVDSQKIDCEQAAVGYTEKILSDFYIGALRSGDRTSFTPRQYRGFESLRANQSCSVYRVIAALKYIELTNVGSTPTMATIFIRLCVQCWK